MTDAPRSIPSFHGASWRSVLMVFLVALGVRAGYGLTRGGELVYDDEHWYWALSRAVAAGQGLVGEFGHRAERMPLYPWMLSLFPTVDAARAAQWVVGALAAGLVCALAGWVCRRAWMAGLIAAFDPTLVGSASLLLSETLAVTAIAGLWLAAWPIVAGQRGSWARWAVVAALAALCVHVRESLLLCVIALMILVMAVWRDRRAVAGGAAVAMFVVLTLAPWGLRNQRLLGSWYWFTTRGGISLYDGVRPGATGASDLAGVKDLAELSGLNEVEWDRHFRSAAWRAIADEPGRIAGLVPVKLARTWSPVLNAAEFSARSVQMVFAAWYVPLYVLIVVGAWARRRDKVLLWTLVLPALCVSLLHMVFVGSVRYRLPALPALAVLAGLGACWVWSGWRGRRAVDERD